MDEELWELTFAEFELYLDELSIRQLQREAARATTMPQIIIVSKFNAKAHLTMV